MKPRYVVAICFQVVGFLSLCFGLWQWDWHATVFAACVFVMATLVIASGVLREQRRAASFRR